MTEYLILNQARAFPLVWEYQKQVNYDPINFTGTLTQERSQWLLSHGGSAGSSYTVGSGGLKWVDWCFKLYSSITTNYEILGTFLTKVVIYWTDSTGSTGTYTVELWNADSDTLDRTTKICDLGSFSVSSSGSGSWTWQVTNPFDGKPLTLGNAYGIRLYSSYEIYLKTITVKEYSSYTSTPSGKFTATKTHRSDGGSNTNRSWQGWQVEVITVLRYPKSSREIFRTDEANKLYIYKSQSLPSGVSLIHDLVNDAYYNLPTTSPGTNIPFPQNEKIEYTFDFYTTSDINNGNVNTTLYPSLIYEVNPVTLDMFYASEAYLQKIEYLQTSSKARLNDSPLQEFSGDSGAITFDPPIIVWKIQNISGKIRATMMVLE